MVLAALALFASGVLAASEEKNQDATVAGHASGPFEVKLSAQTAPGAESDSNSLPGRMSVDKKYFGELQGTGKGEMLTAMTATSGSAGYVAIERVSGTLMGRIGTFMLQHNGTMSRGVQSLSITVVPDSGTGGLTGITGQMKITIGEGGQHSYDFDYTLPAMPPP